MYKLSERLIEQIGNHLGKGNELQEGIKMDGKDIRVKINQITFAVKNDLPVVEFSYGDNLISRLVKFFLFLALKQNMDFQLEFEQ